MIHDLSIMVLIHHGKHRLQGPVEMTIIITDHAYAEDGPLPFILITNFRHRNIKAGPNPVLETFENTAFGLKGIRCGDMQVNRKYSKTRLGFHDLFDTQSQF